jgi:hypothetical protein
MPADTEFTLSLFDTTALSGWNPNILQAVAQPDEADAATADQPAADEADERGGTSAQAVDPIARGSNFHLAGERVLARFRPARAHDNIAAITLSKALEQPRPDRR